MLGNGFLRFRVSSTCFSKIIVNVSDQQIAKTAACIEVVTLVDYNEMHLIFVDFY